MLIRKSFRTLLATAALGTMAQISWAGCNCSVPPSPAAATGMGLTAPWSGAQGYDMSGYGMSGYGMSGNGASGYGISAYGMPQSGPSPYGMSGYGMSGYPMSGYPMSGYPMSPGNMSAVPYGGMPMGSAPYNANGAVWAPGGYEARVGSPVNYHDPAGGQYVNTGNPYYDHYGPGFHRNSVYGHYRFPYYTYRAPWYYPGKAVYNRDTNFSW